MTNDEAMFVGFLDGTDVVLAICENALNAWHEGRILETTMLKAIEDEVMGEVAKRMTDPGAKKKPRRGR